MCPHRYRYPILAPHISNFQDMLSMIRELRQTLKLKAEESRTLRAWNSDKEFGCSLIFLIAIRIAFILMNYHLYPFGFSILFRQSSAIPMFYAGRIATLLQIARPGEAGCKCLSISRCTIHRGPLFSSRVNVQSPQWTMVERSPMFDPRISHAQKAAWTMLKWE